MPIIGNNTLETGAGANPAQSFGIREAAFQYTAVANDFVTTLNWYGAQSGLLRPASIQVAVYETTGLIPNLLATPVHQFNIFSSFKQWHNHTLATPFALTIGVNYTICFASFINNYDTRFKIAAIASSTGLPNTLPALWAEIATGGRRWMMYADVVNIPPPAVKILYPCCAQLIA